MDWIIKDLNKQLSSVNYGIENDVMTPNMRIGFITKRRELIAAILILESAMANIPSVNKQMNYDSVLCAVIMDKLPNKTCILNNYIGTKLEARNASKDTIQVKLPMYKDWFTVPTTHVEIFNGT